MRLFRTAAYRSNGRLQGSYVYLILCVEDRVIYTKIGVSDNPIQRLTEILVGCPFEPEIIATVELSNRARAFRLESALHAAMRPWHIHGEWFRFVATDKARFNELSRIALSEFASPSWPMAWTKLNARALVKQQRAAAWVAGQAHAAKQRKGGKSLRDFRRHQKP